MKILQIAAVVGKWV